MAAADAELGTSPVAAQVVTDSQPVSRADPLPFGAALGATADAGLGFVHTLETFVADLEQKARDNPNSYFAPGICKHCGTDLGSNPDDKAFAIAGGFLPLVCCEPCAKAGKIRIEAEQKAAYESQFAGIIPTEFIEWHQGKGNNTALAKAVEKLRLDPKKGLLLHGVSGTCKTRIMWQLVKKLVESPTPTTYLVLDAFELSTMPAIPKDAYFVQHLFIDDLGNEAEDFKAKKRFETSLLHLIRRRNDWHRPTTITTQLTGRDFMARFFNGAAAQAILRRWQDRMATIDTSANFNAPLKAA